MNRIQRYIFARATKAFVLCLATLIGVVWLTQALRELDLLTAKGQTILVFFQITWLVLPKFVSFIAPVAILLAAIHTLNTMNSDSETVIITNSGAAPSLVAKPLIVLACLIACIDASISHYFSPHAQRQVRAFVTEINSDIIASVIRPGEFTSVNDGITFYVGAREPNGIFRDVFLADNRDEQQSLTYLAENGAITRTNEGTFFVLQNGTIHRRPTDRDSISIVEYSSYAFDLSTFEQRIPDEIRFVKPSENYSTYLMQVDPENAVFVNAPNRFYAELHSRIASPLFSISFVMIALYFLGQAATTRQGRSLSILAVVVTAATTKGLAVTAQSLSEGNPVFMVALYVLPIGTIAVTGYFVFTARYPNLHSVRFTALEELVRRSRRRQDNEGRA